MRTDILERLRIDPGTRTLGQLLQDREAAIHEIGRLRVEAGCIATKRAIVRPARASPPSPAKPIEASTRPAVQSGALVRLAGVCELLGMSRSSVYKLISEGKFPAPVRVSVRSVRWRVDALEAWRDALPR